MFLAAGRLRQRITFQRPVSSSTGKGGYTKSWETIAEDISAEVVSQAGRESVIANALQGVASYKITVRHRTDLKAKYRVLYGDEVLNITAPPVDPDGRRTALVIFADTDPQP